MSYHECPIEPSDWSDGPGDPIGEECRHCEGVGEIIDDRDNEQTYPYCDGSGYVPIEPLNED